MAAPSAALRGEGWKQWVHVTPTKLGPVSGIRVAERRAGAHPWPVGMGRAAAAMGAGRNAAGRRGGTIRKDRWRRMAPWTTEMRW